MSPKNNVGRFILRIFACLFGLLVGFSMLTENASMQDEEEIIVTTTNANVASNFYRSNANYRPTPEPPKATLRGKVFYAETGRPVKRAVIMLMRDEGGGPGEVTGLTDGEGNFQIKNVRPGIYYAMINAPGVVSPMAFADFSLLRGGAGEKEAFEKAFENFDKIVVPEGVGEIEVQIPARRGGAIGGRVIYDDGDPAIGVKVEILRKLNGKYTAVIPNFSAISSIFGGGGGFQTDDRGVYRLAGLPPGEYVVKVTENTSHNDDSESNSYGSFERLLLGGGNSFLNTFYPDAADAKSAQVINLELGQEMGEINLTLPSRNLFKIAGRVISRAGKAPIKARIKIKREGDNDVYSLFSEITRREQNLATDEKGNWKFKELPKGNYKLIVEPIEDGGADDESGIYEEGAMSNVNVYSNSPAKNALPKLKFAKKIQEIIIEDRDLSEIVVELGSGATVSGTIAVENSRELPKSVTVAARNESGEFNLTDTVSNDRSTNLPGMSMNTNRVNSSGRITTKPEIERDFKLENVAEGKTFFYIHHDDDFYVKSAKADGVDLLAGPLELKDGETIKNVQIIFSKDVGTLKGKILDQQNEPLKNGDFLLVPTDAAKQKNSTYFREVHADAAGDFEKKVPPGEYAIVFPGREAGEDGKYEEFFKRLIDLVKDAQKITIEAGKTEKLTVKKTGK